MGYIMNGFSGFRGSPNKNGVFKAEKKKLKKGYYPSYKTGEIKKIEEKPVIKKPTEGMKEVNIKTDSSKLYGLDGQGFEPSVTEEDSPNKSVKDWAKNALTVAKPFLKGAVKRVAGPVGLVLKSTPMGDATLDGKGLGRDPNKSIFTKEEMSKWN